MSETLTYTDSINRIGYTKINGELVVEHMLNINKSDPTNMSLSYTKLNPSVYKENRELCRADVAEFEDLAYALQDECLADLSAASEDATTTE